VKLPLTARVDWRESPTLWMPVAWLCASLWPPIVGTLILFPPSEEAGGLLRDWRAPTLLAGALGVAAALFVVDRERRREQAPRTRLGVVVRFLILGFIFTLISMVVAAVLATGIGLFNADDLVHKLGTAKATLFWFSVPMMFFALPVGISYALWAGLVVAMVAFSPRPQSVRPRHYLFDRLAPEQDEAAPQAAAPAAPEPQAPPPAPKPEPEPRGPQPETEQERGLRPDWD
jgi:hypothetical protein